MILYRFTLSNYYHLMLVVGGCRRESGQFSEFNVGFIVPPPYMYEQTRQVCPILTPILPRIALLSAHDNNNPYPRLWAEEAGRFPILTYAVEVKVGGDGNAD